MPLPRDSRAILETEGIWTSRIKKLTFSKNTSKRKGTCDGSGRNSRMLGAEGLKLCRNRNACRLEGVRSSSWLDDVFPGDASSSEVSDLSPARFRVSISSPSSSSATRDQKPLLTYRLWLAS